MLPCGARRLDVHGNSHSLEDEELPHKVASFRALSPRRPTVPTSCGATRGDFGAPGPDQQSRGRLSVARRSHTNTVRLLIGAACIFATGCRVSSWQPEPTPPVDTDAAGAPSDAMDAAGHLDIQLDVRWRATDETSSAGDGTPPADAPCPVGLCTICQRCEEGTCVTDPSQPDTDGDGVCDVLDNCPLVTNPAQADPDGDGLGSVCDPCPNANQALPLSLAWPLAGTPAVDWVIVNYVDHDPTIGGLADYTQAKGEAAKTYDGHAGTDINVPNFRWMDQDIAPIYAAATGTVVEVHDGAFDRETTFDPSCGKPSNRVIISHSNGTRALYLHMKKGSVAVSVGQHVEQGQVLGLVGSSGCSSAPHLHFELRGCGDEPIDPFEAKLWADQPAYAPPIGIMDVVVTTPQDDAKKLWLDPPPTNQLIWTAGQTLVLVLIIGSAQVGDTIATQFVTEGGAGPPYQNLVVDKALTASWWYWTWVLPELPGAWQARIFLNGVESKTVAFTINAP